MKKALIIISTIVVVASAFISCKGKSVDNALNTKSSEGAVITSHPTTAIINEDGETLFYEVVTEPHNNIASHEGTTALAEIVTNSRGKPVTDENNEYVTTKSASASVSVTDELIDNTTTSVYTKQSTTQIITDTAKITSTSITPPSNKADDDNAVSFDDSTVRKTEPQTTTNPSVSKKTQSTTIKKPTDSTKAESTSKEHHSTTKQKTTTHSTASTNAITTATTTTTTAPVTDKDGWINRWY